MKNGEKFVNRLTYNAGWWVRITNKGEELCSKQFFDKTHEGKDTAYKKAVEFKNQMCKKLNIDYADTRKPFKESCKKSKTSYVGICLTKTCKPYGTCFNWRARVGREHNRSFSVAKYGYEGAFLKAVEFRFNCINREVPKDALSSLPTPEQLLDTDDLRLFQRFTEGK